MSLCAYAVDTVAAAVANIAGRAAHSRLGKATGDVALVLDLTVCRALTAEVEGAQKFATARARTVRLLGAHGTAIRTTRMS